MKLYNSMSRQIEEFLPLNEGQVSMYTCGPTVYDYATIGNFRTYTTSDLLSRVLAFNGYKVKAVMNFTDVGHLTGDNAGMADEGVDRIEAAAEKEGKTAKDITDFYIKAFLTDYEKLNLLKPYKFTRATEYIKQQIELIEVLESKGFTYKIDDGVYFDTSKAKDYGKLAGTDIDAIKEGARIEPNPQKKNPTDFALWKLSNIEEHRWQEWDSPWGLGFPGWHLECSAMIKAELGDTIDIHVGGEDLKMIHHPNEIAQSECAWGKDFVKYWVHGTFLQVDGGRMGKSLGNGYTVSDIVKRGFDPMALRYFYMSSHYRGKSNFTWEGMESAQNALRKLYEIVNGYEDSNGTVDENYYVKFISTINEDLSMPKALAVTWDLLKADLPEGVKIVTLLKFDEVLGLDLENHVGYDIPEDILNMAKSRLAYRKAGIWDKADLLRKQIEKLGYVVEDTPQGPKVKRKV